MSRASTDIRHLVGGFLSIVFFIGFWPFALSIPVPAAWALTILWWVLLIWCYRRWRRYNPRRRRYRGGYRRTTGREFPDAVKRRIWNRDGGRCVSCGTRRNLEYDHIFPWSLGGKSTYANGQLLCRRENRIKSNHVLSRYL